MARRYKIARRTRKLSDCARLDVAIAELSEYELFVSHIYGVINMILGAALRCVRVSHYDTQAIHARLSEHTDTLFDEVRALALSDMQAFAPQADILASMHEKGAMRMFMN
jgi:urease accessory protein